MWKNSQSVFEDLDTAWEKLLTQQENTLEKENRLETPTEAPTEDTLLSHTLKTESDTKKTPPTSEKSTNIPLSEPLTLETDLDELMLVSPSAEVLEEIETLQRDTKDLNWDQLREELKEELDEDLTAEAAKELARVSLTQSPSEVQMQNNAEKTAVKRVTHDPTENLSADVLTSPYEKFAKEDLYYTPEEIEENQQQWWKEEAENKKDKKKENGGWSSIPLFFRFVIIFFILRFLLSLLNSIF